MNGDRALWSFEICALPHHCAGQYFRNKPKSPELQGSRGRANRLGLNERPKTFLHIPFRMTLLLLLCGSHLCVPP